MCIFQLCLTQLDKPMKFLLVADIAFVRASDMTASFDNQVIKFVSRRSLLTNTELVLSYLAANAALTNVDSAD